MSAVQAVATPIYGQAIRLYGCIVNTSTGNPIGAALTTPTVTASIDGAAFSATGLTVTDCGGTTGYFYIEADATRMTGNCIIFKVVAANANAREWFQVVYPAVLTEAAGLWIDATVKRLEQGTVDISASSFNRHDLSQSTETVYARDSTTALFTGTVSGLQSPGGTVTRNKMS